MPIIISRHRGDREYRLIFDALDRPQDPRLYAAFTKTADGRVVPVRDLQALLRCWDERELRDEVIEAARANLREEHPMRINPARNAEFKRWAWREYRRAVAARIIEAPKSCAVCGAAGVRINAHHADYLRPRTTVGLCDRCHLLAHRREGAALH